MDLIQLAQEYVALPTKKRANGMSNESQRVFLLYLKLFNQHLETTNSSINTQSIASFLLKIKSPNSRAMICNRLVGFLQWYNLIDENTASQLKSKFKMQQSNWSSKALDFNFLPTLSHTIKRISKTEFSKSRNQLLLFLLSATACRISQALDLKIKDIIEEDDEYVIMFNSLKKNEYNSNQKEIKKVSKDFFIGNLNFDSVYKLYLKKREQYDNEYLFVTSRNKKLTDREVRLFFNVLNKELGVKITPHRIRHTIGTYIANNYGVVAAAKLLNHSQIATTQKYIALDKIDIKVPSIK
ncbi:tyrosine-type recombinase/integrase [Caldisericum sp.]|uniref:tyrosine-type recombinase/integrase n=1 Tax=Caldisericum sp. TaxID=2499687 RepID=UPI003D0F8694